MFLKILENSQENACNEDSGMNLILMFFCQLGKKKINKDLVKTPFLRNAFPKLVFEGIISRQIEKWR